MSATKTHSPGHSGPMCAKHSSLDLLRAPSSRQRKETTINEVNANLNGMDRLDFDGWNNADWHGLFGHEP